MRPSGVDAGAEPRLLTVAEYLAIGEIEPGYTELVEGRLLLSPSPVPAQQGGAASCGPGSTRSCPPELVVRRGHRRRPAARPGRRAGDGPPSRRDRRATRARPGSTGGRVSGRPRCVLAVEFVSPGSRRTDHVPSAPSTPTPGIPHYWIVDLDEPVSLVACHLGGEFGYVDGGAVTGVFRTTEPFPVEIDLDALG